MILTKDELYRKGFDFVIDTLNRGESINLIPTAKVSHEIEEELHALVQDEVFIAKPIRVRNSVD